MTGDLQNDNENEKIEVVILAETAQIIDRESLYGKRTSLRVFTFVLVGYLLDEQHVLDLFSESTAS